MAARSASTDRHRRKRISVRRDENLGRSKTTARVSFASPVKNHHGRSISHSRREPEMSKSNSRREPGRSTSKGKREPGRGLSNSRRKPGRSTSNSRREPGRSTSNSKREPGRSSSGVRLQESRIDVVDVTSSSRCSTSSSNYSPLEKRTSRVTEHSFTSRADWAGRYSEERSSSRSRRRQRNQEEAQYFVLPMMGNTRREDRMEAERRRENDRRMGRQLSKDEEQHQKREGWNGLRSRRVKVQNPHKASRSRSRSRPRMRQATEERGLSSRGRGGSKDVLWGAPGKKGGRVTRERGKERAYWRSENWGRGSPSASRIQRREGRRSSSRSPSGKKDGERGMFKYQRDRENESVAAKIGPRTKKQESDQSVWGEQKGEGVDEENFTRNDDQQDSALRKDDGDDFEDMLKRNQEYVKAAALPSELVQDFDQGRSQEEEKGNLCETPLGEKVDEEKEVKGGESRDEEVSSSEVQEESLETDMESKPKSDLNQTVSVHTSPEVEVMADVETTVEEEEEKEESSENVEQKLKELATRRAFIFAKMDRLKKDIKVLQEEVKKAGEEEKSLKEEEEKLQAAMANFDRKAMPM